MLPCFVPELCLGIHPDYDWKLNFSVNTSLVAGARDTVDCYRVSRALTT